MPINIPRIALTQTAAAVHSLLISLLSAVHIKPVPMNPKADTT